VTTETPTLEPFVTGDELKLALAGEELSDEQAAFLAEWGSAAVRAEVNQIVNVVRDDLVILRGSGSTLMLLPELAVLKVTEVVIGERELREHEFDYDHAGCMWRLWRGSQMLLRHWPIRERIVVTYDHGWEPHTPQFQAARHVALEVATRTFRNPGMLQSERIGDWSRAWVPTGGRAALTDQERTLLDLLRTGR
jgi:hypothetical protein